MPIQLPTPNPHIRDGGWTGPKLLAAAVALAGVVATIVFAWMLPAALVLPALGALAIGTATVLALIAWVTAQRMTATISYWDIVGALTFVGIFAALLSEAELALPLLESRQSH